MITKLLAIRQKLSEIAKLRSDNDKAGQYFDWMKVAIREIENSAWYEYIKRYREQEANNALDGLKSKKDTDAITYHQAKLDVAISFLDFLDNLKD